MAPRYLSVHACAHTRAHALQAPSRALVLVAPCPHLATAPSCPAPCTVQHAQDHSADTLVQDAGAVLSTCCWIPGVGPGPFSAYPYRSMKPLVLRRAVCGWLGCLLWDCPAASDQACPQACLWRCGKKGVAAGRVCLPPPPHARTVIDRHVGRLPLTVSSSGSKSAKFQV